MSFSSTFKSNPKFNKESYRRLIPPNQARLILWVKIFFNLFTNKKGKSHKALYHTMGCLSDVNSFQTNSCKKRNAVVK
jgi:hypothetical protein